MDKKTAAMWLCLVLATVWHPFAAIAGEAEPVVCVEIQEPYSGTLFVELYKTTKKTAKAFCEELVRANVGKDAYDNTRMNNTLRDLAVRSKEALDHLKLGTSADYGAQFDALNSTFAHFDLKNPLVPLFKTESSMAGGPVGYFTPLENKTDRFAINEVDDCAKLAPGSSCRAIFDDFAKAFNPYRSSYDKFYATKNAQLLKNIGDKWDKFLEVSKSQTVLEVLLTTWVNKSHFQENHLVGPPNYQIIALHPQLVYDSLEKAPDGSNQAMGLAVEWVGVNFWALKVPLGISFASVYVDRANVRDIGNGVLLHINNHYAIGWANYGHNANSVYVTIDLLKMFEDKKAKYGDYAKSYL